MAAVLLVPCWNNPVGGEKKETKLSLPQFFFFFLLKYNGLGSKAKGKQGFEGLSCFISQTPRSLLQATVFTWIQDSGFKSFPLLILQNWRMGRRLWRRWMIQLHLGILMVFAEKLQDAIKAPPPPPHAPPSTSSSPGWWCQRQLNLWQQHMLKFNALLQRAVFRRKS